MTHFCVRNVDSSFTQGVWLWPDWLMSLVTSLDKGKRQSHVFWPASYGAQQLFSSSSTSGWWSFRLSALGCEQRHPPPAARLFTGSAKTVGASGGQLDWPSGATRRWGGGSQILAFSAQIFPAVAGKWSRTLLCSTCPSPKKGAALASAAASEGWRKECVGPLMHEEQLAVWNHSFKNHCTATTGWCRTVCNVC